MKCQVCGENTPILMEGPNGEGLCQECNDAQLKANDAYLKEQENKIIDITSEVEEADEAPSNPTKIEDLPTECEVRIGVKVDGSIYFTISGEKANLLTLDGLLKYAERRVKQHWDLRDEQAAQAAEGKTE